MYSSDYTHHHIASCVWIFLDILNRDVWAVSTGALVSPVVPLVRTRASSHLDHVECRIQVPVLDITAFDEERLIKPDTNTKLVYFVAFDKYRNSHTVYSPLRAQHLRWGAVLLLHLGPLRRSDLGKSSQNG